MFSSEPLSAHASTVAGLVSAFSVMGRPVRIFTLLWFRSTASESAAARFAEIGEGGTSGRSGEGGTG